MNVSMRPSGERAGWLTESGSLVIWTHSDRLGAGAGPRNQTAPPMASAASAAAAIAASRHRFRPRCACSIVFRASAIFCRRRVGSLCRQRCNSSRMLVGVAPGRRPIRLALQHRRDRARQILARKRPLPGEQLVQQATERPDVGPLIDGFATRLLGAHVRGRADDLSGHGLESGHRSQLRIVLALFCAPTAFANPKSSTFTRPSGVTLMLAGFRSRWMMPLPCAASSASAT